MPRSSSAKLDASYAVPKTSRPAVGHRFGGPLSHCKTVAKLNLGALA